MSGRRGTKVRAALAALLAVCLAVTVAACGSSDSSGGGSEKKISGAKVIDPASLDSPPKGTIHYCTGKDTSGAAHQVVADFNKKYSGDGYKVELTEFPADADQQRAQFIQRQQAKSDDCDVFNSDVIWTAEFASQKWLYDLSPYVEKAKDQYIQAPLETVHYGGKYWGVPATSDAAFLFYRTDKGSGKAPATWQDAYSEAKKEGGIIYQGKPYEGLTCDYLEIAFAAGGEVLSDDGKKSAINSPENEKALQFMVDGIKDSSAPKAVTTYGEPETDQQWATARYGFMRNWTGSYALGNGKDSKVKGKFKVAALPTFEGGGKAGILGGHNSSISVYTKNPGLALKFADFYASPEWQKVVLLKYSQAAVNPATYDDPDVKKAIPYSAELKQAISQAKPRPVSPVYPQISQAIYKNVNDALAGRVSPKDALANADKQINSALSTF
jgi:multiple sugar transport system substrate-binding protein